MATEKRVAVTLKMTIEQRKQLRENAHENRMDVSKYIRFKTIGEK